MPPPLTVEALMPFIRMLLEQVKDLYARCEAQRLVLQAHGLLPDDDYQRERERCEALWDSRLTEAANQYLKDVLDADWQRLLETHKGKPQ